MTTKHTPGPWSIPTHAVPQSTVIEAHGRRMPIATLFCRGEESSSDMPYGDEVIANARLIAAAPELLAALRQFEQALIPVDRALGPTGDDVWPEIAQAIIAARAAIAKATEVQS